MKSWIGQRSKPESYHFDSFCTGKSVSLWWAMKVMTIPRSSQTRTSSSRYINTDMVGYSELMSYPWYCRLKKDEKGIYKDVSMAGDLLYRNLQRFVPSVFYNHSSFCNLFLSAGKRQTICGLEAFCGWILNDRKYHMPIFRVADWWFPRKTAIFGSTTTRNNGIDQINPNTTVGAFQLFPNWTNPSSNCGWTLFVWHWWVLFASWNQHCLKST